MSNIRNCLAALDFEEMPETEQEVVDRCNAKMEKHKDSTESDRLARQLLRENRDMCIAEMRRRRT